MTKYSNSEWDLMSEGNFLDAYSYLSTQIKNNPEKKHRYLHNRALCLLNLKQPEKALLDFSELIVIKPESASGYIGAGVSSWWLNMPNDSIMYWRQALDAKYNDSAGGVEPSSLLLFAAISMKRPDFEKDAIILLKKTIGQKPVTRWPGAIGSFLMGKIDYLTFYTSANSSSNIISRKLCKFYFWVAINNFREGNVEDYSHNLNLSVQTNSILEYEYYLAKIEIFKSK